jgi:hypothetical protein
VEVPSDLPSPKPQLLPAASQQSLPKNSPEELIWEIFRKEDGGELRLDITNLKAASKRDHTLRLVYLYLI